MKINEKLLLVVAFSAIFTVQAAEQTKIKKQIRFLGQISDASCQVTIGKPGNDGNVYLAPVSLADVMGHHPGTFLKPQPFNLVISNCLAVEGAGHPLSRVTIRWVSGNLQPATTLDNGGYLANIRPDGARNIFLVLASNGDKNLDHQNKIVIASEQQVQVNGRSDNNGNSLFTYYVGYVAQQPNQVTTGLIDSYATYLISYN